MTRRRKVAIALVAVVGVLAIAGAFHQGYPGRILAGRSTGSKVSCAWHGWRAIHNLRRHHPLWTSYHVWRASSTCARAIR